MLKPASLRKHLVEATPELRTNPDKLTVYLSGGKIVAAGTGSLAFEYRYTLQLVVLDYATHPDAILVPLLAWLTRNQIEIFDNPDLRERAIRFEAEFLNGKTIDLTIEVDLSERVLVGRRPGAAPETTARFDIEHVGEPQRPGPGDTAEIWELYFRDQLLATWQQDPRP